MRQAMASHLRALARELHRPSPGRLDNASFLLEEADR